MILPCIDLMDGKAVQLVQGRDKALEVEDIDSLIESFRPFGEIQLIDLDAAMSKGDNLELIKEISKKIKCRVGGGIRTVEKAGEVIAAGAEKIIVGSSAFKNGNINIVFLKKLVGKIGKDKIIIAVDTKQGSIVVEGWTESTGIKPETIIKQLEPYCSEFLCTFVDKEGMLHGTNTAFFKRIKFITENELTAAGGITTLDEVKELKENDINSALGMAIYTQKIKLGDLLRLK